MKTIMKTLYIFFSILFIVYLALPDFDFPFPPNDALQSVEPADTETPLRRAYFTDYGRQEVLSHFKSQFERSNFLNLPLPTYRLNYPPEEAHTIIRDQTRSTFLEEITHPLRESFYVNGFQARDEKDTILISGKVWFLKVTTRFVQSSLYARMLVGFSILVLIPLITKSWLTTLASIKKEVAQRWNFR